MRSAARGVLRLFGWRIAGQLPNVPRLVIIVAPHRSNWDWVIGMLAILAMGIRVHWLGKHSLFRPGTHRLFRWLGGTPVDRRAAGTVVEQAAARVREADQFLLALAPEGTRQRVERFKTGFYRIARAADVPILPIYFDYPSRTIGLMEIFHPTTDSAADLGQIEAMYRRWRE